MDRELQELLQLAGYGVRGKAAPGPKIREGIENPDYLLLLQRAGDLEVYPYCVRALQKNRELGTTVEGLAAKAEEVRSQARKQALGREKLFGFLRRMEEAGFTYAVIKGCAIAESYGEPFLRVSSDTDLLIDEQQEQKLYHWLEKEGFYLEKRERQEYHGVARNREIGILELHTAFSDPRIAAYWQKKAESVVSQTMQHSPVYIKGRQGSFYSLEYTEQMLFVTLHFIRHLFAMEGTLRMLLDNCMYASYYRKQIDWTSYREALDGLGYGKLVKTMFLAADTYMGFDLTGEKGIHPPDSGKTDKKLEVACVGTEDMEGLLEILCAPEENLRIADRFKDLYRSREMNLGENAFVYRMKALWGVALYTAKRTRKDGLLSVLMRAPGKAKRILTGRDNRTGNEEEAEWMRKRREVFGRLGLMRDEKDS